MFGDPLQVMFDWRGLACKKSLFCFSHVSLKGLRKYETVPSLGGDKPSKCQSDALS